MNVNCKISLTDEERNVMFKRLTGKNGKGMVSRADVNNWVKEKLESFLLLGSPTTESITQDDELEHRIIDDIGDLSEQDIEDVMRQNVLLTTRVNRLQHMIDTRGLKN